MSQTDDSYLKQLQARYRKASKNEKTVILDEYVKTTGYHRKHATAVLNGRRERVQGPVRRPRRAQYGVEEAKAIASLADLFDHICSKRLRAAMDVELPRLYQAGILSISATCYLCWLLNSSTRVSCAEIATICYHAVQSTIHLESITA